MHAAHGVGHAIAGRTSSHVVGVQGAARATARGDGEVGLACQQTLFLISARHRVLEAGRVGRVAGDGHIDILQPQDGHAFANVVGTVAVHLRAETCGVGDTLHDGHLASVVVELGAAVGEAVDAADDLGGVFAEAVEDDTQERS